MIIHGDSLEKLKDVDGDSVDLLCTDPPYGYSFMGKSWDKTLPDIGIFKECLRVLKPGAFAFVMSAPRSDVCARMMLLLEDAGFEIGFTPIAWTFASGFPKAGNTAKVLSKRGKEKEAKTLEGSYLGFQPKPAWEMVIVAMKPLSEKTYVDQALKNGKGITWLDDVRIPITGKYAGAGGRGNHGRGEGYGFEAQGDVALDESKGRFPANLLVSDDVLNDGVSRGSTSIPIRKTANSGGTGNVYQTTNDVPGNVVGYGDTGSYSRFFSLDAWAQNLPFLQVPKASKREKNEGLEGFEEKQALGGGGITSPSDGEGRVIVSGDKGTAGKYGSAKAAAQNHHPTVKPLTLMSYLITLGSRPGDVVLDPFLGSGTTAIAAKQLGRACIGIEREEEYVKISEARIAAIPNTLL